MYECNYLKAPTCKYYIIIMWCDNRKVQLLLYVVDFSALPNDHRFVSICFVVNHRTNQNTATNKTYKSHCFLYVLYGGRQSKKLFLFASGNNPHCLTSTEDFSKKETDYEYPTTSIFPWIFPLFFRSKNHLKCMCTTANINTE